MSKTRHDTAWAAALAGAATGVRSMGPLALLASGGLLRAALPDGPGWTRGPWAVRALALAAAGEAVADKLAPLPARTEPVPLAGRAVIGGLLGALAGRSRREGMAVPALLAAAAAAGAAVAVTRGRSALTERGAPDALVALAEDVLALGATRAAADLLDLSAP